MRGIIRKEAKVQKSSFKFYYCRCFGDMRAEAGSKSLGFIVQFGALRFQFLRQDFQSLGLIFQSQGLCRPAAAWGGTCLVGTAEQRGNGGERELESVHRWTVGRGIAGAGENLRLKGLKGLNFKPFSHFFSLIINGFCTRAEGLKHFPGT